MKKKRLSKEKAAEIVKLLGEGKDAKELAEAYNFKSYQRLVKWRRTIL